MTNILFVLNIKLQPFCHLATEANSFPMRTYTSTMFAPSNSEKDTRTPLLLPHYLSLGAQASGILLTLITLTFPIHSPSVFLNFYSVYLPSLT